MKKTLILVCVLAVFALIAWKLIQSNPEEKVSYDTSQSEFAIEDIDQITRIFISDKQGRKIDLKKGKKEWVLNDTYRADQNSVNLLLKGIKSLDIQYIPPRAATDNVIKTMASFGLQVEIFGRGNAPLKKYFIGGMTQDERGTYFLMDNSDQPYVMEVKGFVGNVRERFKPEINRFRSQKFIAFDSDEITSIEANYPKQSENNFRLEKRGGQFEIVKPETMKGPAGRGQVESYIDRLSKLACESFLDDDVRKDSVVAEIPFCELIIEQAESDPIGVRFWQKSVPGDPNALHRLFILRDEEFMLGQYDVLKGAFRNGQFFKP